MSVHFTAVRPVLIVESAEPTIAFFRDRLGLAVVEPAAGGDTLGRTTLERGDVHIVVQSEDDLRRDTGESYEPGPYKASFYIIVDDVERLVPEVADADIVLPLRKTAYGMHEVGVREPGGNIIVFASVLNV